MVFKLWSLPEPRLWHRVERIRVSEACLSPSSYLSPLNTDRSHSGTFQNDYHSTKSYLSVSFWSKVQRCWPYRYKTKSLGGRGLHLGAVDGWFLVSFINTKRTMLVTNAKRQECLCEMKVLHRLDQFKLTNDSSTTSTGQNICPFPGPYTMDHTIGPVD